MKIKFILLNAVVLSVWCTGMAFAGCTINNKITAQIAFSDVVVQRDVPVGTVLANWNHPATMIKMATCSGSTWSTYGLMMYQGAIATGIAHVYATNIPGVGFYAPGPGDNWGYDSPANVHTMSGSQTISDNLANPFQLIKTGPITSGSLSAGLASIWYMETSDKIGLQYSMTSSRVTVLACSLQTTALTFPIGNIPVSSFGTTVGATPSVAQNTQNLGLNCDAGANINVSLSGTQNPDVGTTSVLALTGQGGANVAKGVGVQILYNGAPLVLNNRILLKQSAGGQETFPLTARYYQTKTAVTPGTANSSATLNLTYQ